MRFRQTCRPFLRQYLAIYFFSKSIDGSFPILFLNDYIHEIQEKDVDQVLLKFTVFSALSYSAIISFVTYNID